MKLETFDDVVASIKSQQYDEHIIDAINIAAKHGHKDPERLWSMYIGVYSDDDRKHIEDLARRFKCKVHIYDCQECKTLGLAYTHDPRSM